MTSPRPDGPPLSDAELRALREISQHLVRTDPGLLGPAPRPASPGRARLGLALGAAAVAVCVLALALVAGAPVALVGVIALVGASAVVATIGLRRAPARRRRDTR